MKSRIERFREFRKAIAVEAFKNAALSIGPIDPGCHIFGVTRGQFSMVDIILHCLDQIGPAHLSVWTWVISDFEADSLGLLLKDGRIMSGLLMVDSGCRKRYGGALYSWHDRFGFDSIKFVHNHAKMATLHNDRARVLIRGSFNLNYNPRFEQFDISEGCAGFELVKKMESEIPLLSMDHTSSESWEASGLHFDMKIDGTKKITGLKTWGANDNKN